MSARITAQRSAWVETRSVCIEMATGASSKRVSKRRAAATAEEDPAAVARGQEEALAAQMPCSVADAVSETVSTTIKESASIEASSADATGAPPAERLHRRRAKPDTNHLTKPKVVPGGAVIYVGRLPHGFYEQELRSYLSQFGEVSRLRISRNPKTGASRHYGFVEFRHAEVARIVVETMNNYILMGHLLQCSLMAEEAIHEELWKGANRPFVAIPWRKMEAKRFNARFLSPSEEALHAGKRAARSQEKAAKMAAMGISYDMNAIPKGSL